MSGIGFLGAGTIMQARGNVTGLTTAATLWVVAAIGMTVGAGAFVEATGTTLLVLVVFALSDSRNFTPQSNLGPLIVGLLVMAIGMAYGLNAGYAINPARDFGPRLFTAVAGWGGEVFNAGNGWWWVPIVGPLLGGVAGGFVYDALVGRRHPPKVAG